MRLLRVLLCLVAAPAAAVELGRPPNVDLFLDGEAGPPAAGLLSAAAGHLVAEGRVGHVEARLGIPTFFWAPRPHRRDPLLRAQGLTPEQAARRHLLRFGELYRRTPSELAESARLSRVHAIGRGAVIVSFRMEVDGVPVFRDEL